MSKKHSKVSIDVYDEDGTFCESLGGPMNHEDVKQQMIEILQNDGIPVIRMAGKHEAAEAHKEPNKRDRLTDAMVKSLPKLEDICHELLNPKAIVSETGEITPLTIPMQLDYEFDGIKFHAMGHPLDVHAANNALLKRIFEED